MIPYNNVLERSLKLLLLEDNDTSMYFVSMNFILWNTKLINNWLHL